MRNVLFQIEKHGFVHMSSFSYKLKDISISREIFIEKLDVLIKNLQVNTNIIILRVKIYERVVRPI